MPWLIYWSSKDSRYKLLETKFGRVFSSPALAAETMDRLNDEYRALRALGYVYKHYWENEDSDDDDAGTGDDESRMLHRCRKCDRVFMSARDTCAYFLPMNLLCCVP